MNNIFKVVIEISKGSQLKYEIDKVDGRLNLDRILYGSNIYPQNYGYIEGTLDHDGDPLDVVVISNHSLTPGSTAECRILGSIGMIDGGDRDTKLLAVINVDNRYKSYTSLKHIPTEWIEELEDFFKNYKNLEKKTVELTGVLDWKETEKIIQEGIDLFNKK